MIRFTEMQLKKSILNFKLKMEFILKKHTIDLVISDHRYGFISKKCTSIFITHQLNLPVSGFMKTGDFIHKKLIRSFQEIWVLDTPESKFAGKLSRNSHFENVCYIGPKSRFSLSPKIEKTIPLVVIISGPEPYAEQLFKEQYGKATLSLEKTCIITPKLYLEESDSTQIDIILSSDWKKADLIISQAKKIISRSGYSTIMDLNYLETEFELIPTQGQKEQEYLHQIITQP